MHADLFSRMAEQLLAEAAQAGDLDERGRLIEEAADCHVKAVMAAKGQWVPPDKVWKWRKQAGG
jgi:hypothetical protein